MATTALELAKDLMRVKSVTPHDAGCLDLIVPRLEKLGFTVEHFPCEDVSNAFARRGDGRPLLCFVGHTDVVPTGPLDRWKFHPFTPTVHEGYLYGRGAADMKSGLAAMIVAAEQCLSDQEPTNGSIALLISSSEESKSVCGTKFVVDALEARGTKVDYCIVGEASSTNSLGDVIKNGRRGSVAGHLTIFGKQGHVAYPQLAANPIHKCLSTLQSLVDEEWDKGNDYFQPSNLQISNISAGTGALNVIPGSLECDFGVRHSPELTVDRFKRRVVELLDRHQIKYRIEWAPNESVPFLTKEGRLTAAVTEAVRAVVGKAPQLSTGGGSSDGRYLAPTGAEVVELGPVNRTIHQVDECCLAIDVDRLALMYKHVIGQLLDDSPY